MKQRIYIAAPISKGDLAHNLATATAAAMILIREGYSPLCPQLSVYMGSRLVQYGDHTQIAAVPEVLPRGTTHADWIGVCLPWVSVSDAVLRLPGLSEGADIETAHARKLGIPVYYSLPELFANPPTPASVEGIAYGIVRDMGGRLDELQGRIEDALPLLRGVEHKEVKPPPNVCQTCDGDGIEYDWTECGLVTCTACGGGRDNLPA